MDLVSSIRKSGSRGGVNFSWDDVATSQHRENYLGHSMKAPVGRWQQGKDLSWYTKGDGSGGDGAHPDETPEERAARERKEEIRRIKEAEEDAINKALGLPPKQRDTTGANAIAVEGNRVAPAPIEESAKPPKQQDKRGDRHSRRRDGDGERQHRRRHRHRSRSRDRARDRSPRRRDDRERDRGSHRRRDDGRQEHRRRRSRSGDRDERSTRDSHREDRNRDRTGDDRSGRRRDERERSPRRSPDRSRR